MTRHIYPVTSVIIELDYDLYRKYKIHEQYREIVDLHDKFAESIKEMVKEVAEEYPDD